MAKKWCHSHKCYGDFIIEGLPSTSTVKGPPLSPWQLSFPDQDDYQTGEFFFFRQIGFLFLKVDYCPFLTTRMNDDYQAFFFFQSSSMIINDQIMSMMIKTFGLSAKHVIGDSASHRVLHTLVLRLLKKTLITIFLPNKQASNIME